MVQHGTPEINELRFGFSQAALNGPFTGHAVLPLSLTRSPMQAEHSGILIMATENERREISLSTSAFNHSMEPFARRKRCIVKVDSRITGFWDLRQISTLAQQKIITVPLTSGNRFDPSGLSFLRLLDLQGAVKCTLDQLQPLLEQRSENNTFTRTRQLTTLIVAH